MEGRYGGLTRLPSLAQGVLGLVVGRSSVHHSQPLPALWQPLFSPAAPFRPCVYSDLLLLYDLPAALLLSVLQVSSLPSQAGWAAPGAGLSSTPAANQGNWCCGLFAELFQVVLMEECMCAWFGR